MFSWFTKLSMEKKAAIVVGVGVAGYILWSAFAPGTASAAQLPPSGAGGGAGGGGGGAGTGAGTGAVIASSGMNVKEVQSDLNMLGAAYPPLVVDGVVGPLTTAAIKAFQASVTPPLAVDGVVGPATASALKGAVAALVASQAGASSQSAQGWMGRSPKVMAMAGARMRTRYRY